MARDGAVTPEWKRQLEVIEAEAGKGNVASQFDPEQSANRWRTYKQAALTIKDFLRKKKWGELSIDVLPAEILIAIEMKGFELPANSNEQLLRTVLTQLSDQYLKQHDNIFPWPNGAEGYENGAGRGSRNAKYNTGRNSRGGYTD